MDLPEEVMIEILLRLPVKSLFQFTCVCKGWRALITSPRFVHLHLTCAKNNPDQRLVVKRFIKDDMKILLSIHSSSTGKDQESDLPLVAPHLEVPYYDHESVELIGVCNGIICLACAHFDCICLCNPTTREFKKLPSRPFGCPKGFYGYRGNVGFGFDPNTNDYKVIRVVSFSPEKWNGNIPNPPAMAEIYNLRTNSWRQMDHLLPDIMFDLRVSLLFNGSFHWGAAIAPTGILPPFCILSFDMSSETFGHIQCPGDFVDPGSPFVSIFDGRPAGRLRLGVLDDFLSLVLYSDPWTQTSRQFFHVWVMKEYGVKESWTKTFTIGPLSGINSLLCVWENDKFLLETTEGRLVSCPLRDAQQQLKEFDIFGYRDSLQAITYKESLVTLRQTNSDSSEENS